MLLSKNNVLALVVLTLVSGSFVLAVLDPTTRESFSELTKIAVGTYICFQIPKN